MASENLDLEQCREQATKSLQVPGNERPVTQGPAQITAYRAAPLLVDRVQDFAIFNTIFLMGKLLLTTDNGVNKMTRMQDGISS